MSLVSQVTALAAAVRDKINAMMPRLVPPGGTTGQVLGKTAATDFATSWQTVSGGGGSATVMEVAVDFGAGPKANSFFNIPLAGATVGQKVLAIPSLKPGPGLDEDELEVEPIFAVARVVTPDFVRLLVGPQSPHGRLSGQRFINVILG
jgi:hypothetical protein